MAAASLVMDKMPQPGMAKGEKDILRGGRVEIIAVGSGVAVVFVFTTRDRAEVEVTLGEVAELINIFSVEEGEDLLTTEHISEMNVVIIALVMVG